MVKNQFGIKDLENLSNVKAHTIRIWEKRYNLLEPDRTDTNIRKYDLENLKKLLNVTYLYNAGHKISKIASLNPAQIKELINQNIKGLDSEYMLNIFKSAMFEFDGELFDKTFEKLLEQKPFREIFSEIFVPLLNEMGVLWHSGTIDPSHEHFISEKIKHTIIRHSGSFKNDAQPKSPLTFALYLPYHEIHEIGLLYANYELLAKNQNTIYLGANIPLQSLKHILNNKQKVIFITYFTIMPENDNLEDYLIQFKDEMCSEFDCELWVLGRKPNKDSKNSKNVKFFKNLKIFIDHLKNLTN